MHSSCPVLVLLWQQLLVQPRLAFWFLRSIRIACSKSLYPWWAVSQLLGQSAPLGSECLEEKVEVIPRDDGRRSDRESEEENGQAAVEGRPGFDRPGAKWSAGELLLEPELPRFGSDENDTDDEERPDNSETLFLELFDYPGGSPAFQRHMREEEIGLVSLSCHFALDVLFLSMDY